MATLIAVSTTVSINDRTIPGTIPNISVALACHDGSGFAVSRASYTTLNDTKTIIHAPRMTNISRFAQTIPRNLPSTNSRRLIGFESNVSAVRPSISSATETLAVQIATRNASSMIVISAESLYIFTSSPNVLYGMMMYNINRQAPIASASRYSG